MGWVVAFALAFWVMSAWGQGTGVKNDFTQNVWLPSRLLLNGADPYDPSSEQVSSALGSYAPSFDGATAFNSGAQYHFIYPMWMALAFTPFALLPLTVALALWRALNMLLLVWGIVQLLRVSSPAFRSGRAAAVMAIVLTVLVSMLYRESLLTVYIGQFSIIEFAILVGTWGCLAGERSQPGLRDGLVGVGLALLATKPQAVGLAVLLVMLWAINRRRWAIPAWGAGSLAFLLFVPMIAYPSSLGDWLRIVLGGQAGSQVQVSASVWGVSYQWLGDGLPWLAVAALLTVVGLAALLPQWRHDLLDLGSPVPMSLALTIVINSVISPYLLGYEHILLLFPALLMLAASGLPDEQGGRGWKLWRVAIYGWIAVLPLIVVAVQAGLGGKEYPVIVQSLTMLALVYVARLRWRAREQA